MSGPESLRSDQPLFGFWSATGHPGVIDTAASVRPDYVCMDTQHGVDLSLLDASTFNTLAQYGVPGLVRVDAIDDARIGRALDLGAAGVVIPLAKSSEDARRAVAASRYAPEGTRSYGVQTRRLRPLSDDDPVCWIQIETAESIDHADEIAAVAGVDALYIGPADLGLALCGEPAPNVERIFDGTHPHAETMMSAFNTVVAACERAGIGAGLHCGSGGAARGAIDHGFGITAVGADLPLIGLNLKRELETARTESA